MNRVILPFKLLILSLLLSCTQETENPSNNIDAPATYAFERNGESTVDFSGQSIRLEMGEELNSALLDPSHSASDLQGMYNHEANKNNFVDGKLNASSKNLRGKTAASYDYFMMNSVEANAIRVEFDSWLDAQASEVFTTWTQNASMGQAGMIQELGGGSERHVSAQGLEYNQAFTKSLIGAVMLDQIVNNYLSAAKLDGGSIREDNDAGLLVEGKNYTTMEHYWDEAFGYVYGLEDDITAPSLSADSFLNKYLGRVENDEDFSGIAKEIYDAFIMGRAAIVAKDYEERDAQAMILKEKLSEIIAIRAVYYLEQGKNGLGMDNAAAFHDLSEGFGFIYSLQFTRMPGTEVPYFSGEEVDQMLSSLLQGNGFWDVDQSTLENMAQAIANKFDFSIEQAAN